MANQRVTLRPRIMTAADVKADPNATEDNYLAKVSRYIPGEVVAAYTAASQMVASADDIPQAIVLWIVIAILGILTPLWTLYATNVPGKPKAIFQTVSATVAFLFWVFAISGAVLFPAWYDPVYGGLSLILFTLVIPLVEKLVIK